MKYLLTIVFACRLDCFPPTVTLDVTFDTRAACMEAGRKWVEPAANPQGTVATFACSEKR